MISGSTDKKAISNASDIVLVLTTVPVGELGESLARTLVDEHLAACVNVQPPMTSFYRWDGALQRDEESQLIIKTTADRVPLLRERLLKLHSYELPEFIIVTAAGGSQAYLDWVRSSVEL